MRRPVVTHPLNTPAVFGGSCRTPAGRGL